MPTYRVDPESGAVIFHRTSDEQKLASVVAENRELKSKIDDLASQVEAIVASGKSGATSKASKSTKSTKTSKKSKADKEES